MSSEEEDYMSDVYLKQCENVRPGLANKNDLKLRDKTESSVPKKINQSLPKKKLEQQQRETGLQTEISSSSKGFLLLQKMGYKPGTGIGKSGEGRTEPIPIEVKSGREGLGSEMEMKRKHLFIKEKRALITAKKQKHSERQTQSFISRMKDKFAEKSIERDLRIAQNTCVQLDQKQGIDKPVQAFFWPAHSLPKEDEDTDQYNSYLPHQVQSGRPNNDSDSDVDDSLSLHYDLPVMDKLEILTIYLRDVYNYCIWCGTSYDNEEELSSQCPGNSADSHD